MKKHKEITISLWDVFCEILKICKLLCNYFYGFILFYFRNNEKTVEAAVKVFGKNHTTNITSIVSSIRQKVMGWISKVAEH